MAPEVSILLIRENPEQLTGSGCCGKLEGEAISGDAAALFAHCRTEQEALGVLHRAVRSFFPPGEERERVSVVTVDPRNQLYLTSKLWRDVWCYRPPAGAAIRTMLQLFSLPAVIVNGRVISRRGEPLDPDTLCHHVSEILGRADDAAPSAVSPRL